VKVQLRSCRPKQKVIAMTAREILAIRGRCASGSGYRYGGWSGYHYAGYNGGGGGITPQGSVRAVSSPGM
jgi:hypothetical protein